MLTIWCHIPTKCLCVLQRGQVADELVNRTLENAEADQRSTDTSEDQDDHEEESPLITGQIRLKSAINDTVHDMHCTSIELYFLHDATD